MSALQYLLCNAGNSSWALMPRLLILTARLGPSCAGGFGSVWLVLKAPRDDLMLI